MLIFLAVAYNLIAPYWDTLKKELAGHKFSSLAILHAPNLIGHPVGIGILFALGLFTLPTDPVFFLLWFGLVGAAALGLTLHIWGLLETKFLGVQALSRLAFLTSSLAGVFILGETLAPVQTIALALATVGVICFAWPKKAESSALVWDRGVLFILGSLALSGVASAFYKMSTFYAPDYATFLSGRFIGDLIAWTLIWLVGVLLINRKNPFAELRALVQNTTGLIAIFGIAATTLLSSWLIYELPLTTFAMLTVLAIPSSYLWSRYKYGEVMTLRMGAGALCITLSLLLYLSPSL